MNLILLEERDRIGSAHAVLTGARATHVTEVLRASAGQQLRVGLLDGPIGVATVETATSGRVTLHCMFEDDTPPRPRVDLLLALPRPKVMRRLWAQLAALGVGQILLTNAARVERQYFDTHVLAADCYRPLLIEGLQQARDTRLPEVSIHRQFRVLIEDVLDGRFREGCRVVAQPGAETPLDSALRTRKPERVLLAVGPEGGWNTFELELLAAHDFHAAGMGVRTLRLDTACTALLAIAHAALGS